MILPSRTRTRPATASARRRSWRAEPSRAEPSRGAVRGQGPPARRLTSADFRLAEAFLAASRGGDISALLELLTPAVVRRVDRELVPEDIVTEVCGARAVAEETRLFAARARVAAVALIDGAPGIVVAPRGRLVAILRLTIRAGRIDAIDILGRADRLAGTSIAVPAPPPVLTRGQAWK